MSPGRTLGPDQGPGPSRKASGDANSNGTPPGVEALCPAGVGCSPAAAAAAAAVAAGRAPAPAEVDVIVYGDCADDRSEVNR